MKTSGSPERFESRLACQRCLLHDNLIMTQGQKWGYDEEDKMVLYRYACPECGWVQETTVLYR